jgi:2-amino-4-hydroxy-6-hydroxymethyldihydropteridine diphosphokinase
MSKLAYIGLGSNLNDPIQQLSRALTQLAHLPHTNLIAHSHFYWNKFVGDPIEADCLNAVAAIRTTLTPMALLHQLLALEDAAGRTRNNPAVLARTLDLDLLLYEHIQINQPGLIIPHPRMFERDFVLFPLAEVAPEFLLPLGESITHWTKNRVWDGRRVYI